MHEYLGGGHEMRRVIVAILLFLFLMSMVVSISVQADFTDDFALQWSEDRCVDGPDVGDHRRYRGDVPEPDDPAVRSGDRDRHQRLRVLQLRQAGVAVDACTARH